MQKLLVVGLLAMTSLAGCLDAGDAADTDVGAVLEAPRALAADVLADLQTFASTYSERADNLPAHEGARDWMAAEFEAAGLEVWRHHFENGIAQQNIVGIKWGQIRDEWIVVGAHYDMTTTDCIAACVTRPYSEGAYDDGSGTMMTVHLAKAFAEVDTHYTMAFVAFDGEERGLQGSGAFKDAVVEQAIEPVEDGAITVRGMLDLDMIGLNWPGVDAPIYFDYNSEELRSRIDAKRIELGMPDDMIKYQGISLGRSDYAHFFDLMVPTGFFISDFEEWQLPADIPVTTPPAGRSAYPFWHVEDTYETMLLMAGSQEDLEAGFQTALDLAADAIMHFDDPTVTFDVMEK